MTNLAYHAAQRGINPPVTPDTDTVRSPLGGGAYIRFVDDDGNFIGYFGEEYGHLKLTRWDPKKQHRVELTIGDAGVTVLLYNKAALAAEWSITEEGAHFKKHPR